MGGWGGCSFFAYLPSNPYYKCSVLLQESSYSRKKITYLPDDLVSQGCWWVTLVEVAAWVGWRTWPDGAGVGSVI